MAIFSISSSVLRLWPQMAGAAAGSPVMPGGRVYKERLCRVDRGRAPTEGALGGPKSHLPHTISRPSERVLPPPSGKSL